MEGANKKLIILDCDGVLNRKQNEGYKHVINRTLAAHGVVIEEHELDDRIKQRWGTPPLDIALEQIRDVFGAAAGIKGVLSDARKTYMDILREDFAEIVEGVPGLPQMLGRLSLKHSLALNSASDEEVLFKKVMPKIGIKNPFELFQGGMITAANLKRQRMAPKPAPDTTNALLAFNNVKPEEAVMVGDSHADILTARNAGIEDIVVPLTGVINPEEALVYQKEYGIEIVPDATHLERLLGSTCMEGCYAVSG